MTGRIDGARPAGAPAGSAGAPSAEAPREGDPGVVLEAGSRAPIGASTTAGAAGEGRRLGQAGAIMAFLSDPLVMQGYAQSLLRLNQVEQQQQGIEIQNERAEEASELRADAMQEALDKAEEAKGWGLFAQVAVRVAAVAGAIAGCVAGAFTGGAGVVLAVGLIVLAFGSDLGLALKEAGVDADVTNAIGIGAAAVGTVCTLGASVAGAVGAGAGQAAATAAQTAASQAIEAAARAAEVAARVAAGAATIGEGTLEYQATDHRLDSEAAGVEAGAAMDDVEQIVEEAKAFMDSYRRVVTRLTSAAEAQTEAMRAAGLRRA